MKSSSQQKFLVVSYDDDQQQWFWDYVVASTEELQLIMSARDAPTSLQQMQLLCLRFRRLSVP